MDQLSSVPNRRPLKIRQRAWVHKLARVFVLAGMSPNAMSLTSIGFAGLGAAAYYGSIGAEEAIRALFLIGAAGLIILRLLANVLDGLMAVEEGKKTPAGAIYNELPDRIADSIFLVAAGYAGGSERLGWAAALFAVSTAYVRALGGSLGVQQDFGGPMAKQQRMFTLALGSVLAAIMPSVPVLTFALAIIIFGSAVTVFLRTRRLARSLNGISDVRDQSDD